MGKSSADGVTIRVGAEPKPSRPAVNGLPVWVSVIVRVPVTFPAAVGAKATE